MLITFEGIDGCGKSSQIKLLSAFLKEKGWKHKILREPGGTHLSESIREALLHSNEEISPLTELLLFNAARSHLVHKVIKPTLAEGFIVLCDRFFDSTTAYQGYGRGLDIDMVKSVNLVATEGLQPDITFFLDVPIEMSDRRINKKNADRIEKSGVDFYRRVIEGFRTLAANEKERFFRIDTGGPKELTHKIIIEKVEELYNKKNP
jgi:dTMP kinase